MNNRVDFFVMEDGRYKAAVCDAALGELVAIVVCAAGESQLGACVCQCVEVSDRDIGVGAEQVPDKVATDKTGSSGH